MSDYRLFHKKQSLDACCPSGRDGLYHAHGRDKRGLPAGIRKYTYNKKPEGDAFGLLLSRSRASGKLKTLPTNGCRRHGRRDLRVHDEARRIRRDVHCGASAGTRSRESGGRQDLTR